MSELLSRTVRIKRRLIHRLMGFRRLYQTQLTDGQRVAYGSGATPKTSQHGPNETGTPDSVEMQTNRWCLTGS